jgi:tRNA dimethylallyltransferase
MKEKVIIVVGPTAVGKTKLSIDLAHEVNGEIISADSMQVYKGFDIGSAKPSEEEKEGVVHHLLDHVDPFSEYSVSDYKREAKACIRSILDKNKTPIVTGGTGLYVNALLYDMDFSKAPRDDAYRESLEALEKDKGVDVLYDMLKAVDPKSCEKIHKNNIRKVIRALEVYHVTGQTINDFSSDLKASEDYDYILIGLTRNRKRLYVRINKRVDLMLEAGLIDEVKKLKDLGLSASNASMQGIGYKEVMPFINERYDYEAMASTIKQNTRRYAKRQMTWFRRYEDMHWFDFDAYENYEALKEDVLKCLQT